MKNLFICFFSPQSLIDRFKMNFCLYIKHLETILLNVTKCEKDTIFKKYSKEIDVGMPCKAVTDLLFKRKW